MPCKVKFGNVSGKQFCLSSQTPFKLSQRKDSCGIVFASVCKQVGLVLFQDPEVYSGQTNNCNIRVQLSHLFKTDKKFQQANAKAIRVCCEVKTSFVMRNRTSRRHLPEKVVLESSSPSEKEQEMLIRLNVDDLSQILSSGNVIVRFPRDNQTKTLATNLACKDWGEVSNAILQHIEQISDESG